MTKTHFRPPRARARRLELPERSEVFATRGRSHHGIYDADIVNNMTKLDPKFSHYWDQFKTLLEEAGATAPTEVETPPRVTVPARPYQTANGGYNGPGRPYDDPYDDPADDDYSFPDSPGFYTEQHFIWLKPDGMGGMFGSFHVSRRFLYGLGIVLFLIFLAIYNFPGVIEVVLNFI